MEFGLENAKEKLGIRKFEIGVVVGIFISAFFYSKERERLLKYIVDGKNKQAPYKSYYNLNKAKNS